MLNLGQAPHCLAKVGHLPYFVYISEIKLRLGAVLSGIIRSSATFVYILRHLFIYQRLKLG